MTQQYLTDDDGNGIRFGTGFRVCGIGEDILRTTVQLAFAALGWSFVRSVVFDGSHSLVSPHEHKVHNPFITPTLRGIQEPWDVATTALVISDWLGGRALPSTTPPILNLEGYKFSGHKAAAWPLAPKMADGATNDKRSPEYKYVKGWLLEAGLGDSALLDTLCLIPVWARWGPFDAQRPDWRERK
jgi:hypothetical protein